jgi:hypothetical protein
VRMHDNRHPARRVIVSTEDVNETTERDHSAVKFGELYAACFLDGHFKKVLSGLGPSVERERTARGSRCARARAPSRR